MPVTSRSNKVSRVARTGGSSRRKGESPIGFYAVLIVLAVLGIASVIYSRDERLSETSPNSTPPLEPFQSADDASLNRTGDFWYEAYGIYLCDKFVAPINSDRNPYGLATQNDGIIYIHPLAKAYAGSNATLGLFADGVELPFTEDSIKDPNSDTIYKTGETQCNGQDAELIIKEWEDPTKPDEGQILRGTARDTRVKNNAAVTIAFVPVGKEDIPMPESATNGALQAAPGKDPAAPAAATDPAAIDPAAIDPAAANPAAAEPPAAIETVPVTETTAPAGG